MPSAHQKLWYNTSNDDSCKPLSEYTKEGRHMEQLNDTYVVFRWNQAIYYAGTPALIEQVEILDFKQVSHCNGGRMVKLAFWKCWDVLRQNIILMHHVFQCWTRPVHEIVERAIGTSWWKNQFWCFITLVGGSAIMIQQKQISIIF